MRKLMYPILVLLIVAIVGASCGGTAAPAV